MSSRARRGEAMKLASKRIRALQMLRNKHLANPPKKHDNIPL
jgi:hypothetical protein